MRSLWVLAAILLIPYAALAQSGTITLNNVEVEFAGQTYSFGPGDHELNLDSFNGLAYRGTYEANVTYDTEVSQTSFITAQCEVEHGVEERPASNSDVTVRSVTTRPGGEGRRSDTVTLPAGQVLFLMPPRNDPEREVISTFFCRLSRPIDGVFYASSDEITVRQILKRRQSLTIVEPVQGASLGAPGSTQDIEVLADWEENAIPLAARYLELAAIDSGGNEIASTRFFDLGTIPTPSHVQHPAPTIPAPDGTSRIVLPNVRLPEAGSLTLRLRMVEDFNGLEGHIVEVRLEDEVVVQGEPTASDSIDIIDEDPPRDEILQPGEEMTFTTEIEYTLESEASGAIVVNFFAEGDAEPFASSIPMAVTRPDEPPPALSEEGVVHQTTPVTVVTPNVRVPDEGPLTMRARLKGAGENTLATSSAVKYEVATDLTVKHIELVQVVQDSESPIPLVANKKTAVRVIVENTGARKLADVELTLEGAGRTSESFPISVFSHQGPLESDQALLQARTNESFAHRLPPRWIREGKITIKAAVNLGPDGVTPVIPESDSTNNVPEPKSFQFFDVEPMKVGYVVACKALQAVCEAPSNPHRLMQKLFPLPDSSGVQYIPVFADAELLIFA